ncbi:MAG: ATP-binding cassette domain-containing protein [Clostridia bacterium]|nr:ATP-binding cassette domain-containing protein [Clostridia bacterium]
MKELPDGLDTVIGERGIKLSGGQKQRIVLARMFLRDVDIYIFDEVTRAFDQYSENIIHEAIETIAPDKTIMNVAHRESSIGLCNRKITLD